jgi:hypothetical protein
VKTTRPRTNRLAANRLALVLAFFVALVPVATEAAGLAPRSIQVGSSGQGVTTSYTVNVTTATAASIGSIGFLFCTTPTGACSLPASVTTTSASLLSQSGATGFSINNVTNGAPFITRSASLIGSGVALSFDLGGIVNPSTANLEYYVRVTTYTGIDGATGPVDTGDIAMSTAQPVLLTGVTPEILVFCVGTSIAGNCGTISGSTIDFGDFSPVTTSFGTSVMQAQTNASSGYAITVTGTTLESGVNAISALGVQTASAIGTSQFGLNLRLNTTPGVGADPTGVGSGTYSGNFGSANQYRFNSGDVVASAGLPTDANTFTSSYIVNIGGSQAAGVYTATMTYICTASF